MRATVDSKGAILEQFSAWFDVLRGFAVCSVIIHHWLSFVPRTASIAPWAESVNLVRTVTGTMVQLFFILSGYGLTISYFRATSFTWSAWAKRRFVKIVLPYVVLVTATFLLIRSLHSINAILFETSYSWTTLAVYLLFGKNFCATVSGFNLTLWFMPVILGLYALFPFLLLLLRKRGFYTFMFVSAILTYASITFCILVGYPVTHQTALPFFFVIEFSVGMILAQAGALGEPWAFRLATIKMFGAGMGFYFFSWVLTRLWVIGEVYNDFLTAVGVLLLMLYPCRILIQLFGSAFLSLFTHLSKRSYLMYLLHGTLILFVAKPLLGAADLLPLNPVTDLLCAILCCPAMYLLASLLASPVEWVSALFSRAVFGQSLGRSAKSTGHGS
jgi:peptidoglycan/LPS O-acetylase OafA/YrhL